MTPMKKRLQDHLTYFWWVYVLYAIAIALAWGSAFTALAKPADNEQIILFIGGESLDVESLSADLLSLLPSQSGQNIREVNVEAMVPGTYAFDSILSTRALAGTDLVILSEDAMKSNIGYTHFLPLEETDLIAEFGDGLDYYTEEGIIYGIVLRVSGGEDTHFSEALAEGDVTTYYLFFNAFSVNLGDWNDQGTGTDTAALDAARWLLEGWE